jgi:glycosyltransferase involved in cell wall biosynthesis
VRVLLITHAFPRVDAREGSGSALRRLAVALLNEGVELRVLSPGGTTRTTEQVDGMVVERFPLPHKRLAELRRIGSEARDPGAARSLVKSFLGKEFVAAVESHRGFEPELIHAHWWFPAGLVGSWVAALFDVPLLTELDEGAHRAARPGSSGRPLFRHVLRRSHIITAPSVAVAEAIEQLGGRGRPHVAPLPVAAPFYEESEPRERDGKILILPSKSGEEVVELLDVLASRKGNDTPIEIISAEPLPALASVNGSLNGRVRYMQPPHASDLASAFRRARAVVVAAAHEEPQRTTAEALLCGAPVIVISNPGEQSTLVQHERTGILTAAGDRRAIEKSLDIVLGDPSQAASLGAAGRLHALATFAPESAARRFAGLYQHALGGIPT